MDLKHRPQATHWRHGHQPWCQWEVVEPVGRAWGEAVPLKALWDPNLHLSLSFTTPSCYYGLSCHRPKSNRVNHWVLELSKLGPQIKSTFSKLIISGICYCARKLTHTLTHKFHLGNPFSNAPVHTDIYCSHVCSIRRLETTKLYQQGAAYLHQGTSSPWNTLEQ